VDGNKTAALTVEESKIAPANASNVTADTAKKPANGEGVATAAPTGGAAEVPTSPATTAPPSVAAEKVDNSTAAADDEVAILTFLGVVNGKKVTTPTGKTHFRSPLF
jgi:hypothetical protein